jgi:hypothetical protein
MIPLDVGTNVLYFKAYVKIYTKEKIKFCLYSICIYSWMYKIHYTCYFKAFFKLQKIGTRLIWTGKKYSCSVIFMASPVERPRKHGEDKERNVHNAVVQEDRSLNESKCAVWHREMKGKKETYKAFCWRFACPPGFWCGLVRIFPMVTRQFSTTWMAQSQTIAATFQSVIMVWYLYLTALYCPSLSANDFCHC